MSIKNVNATFLLITNVKALENGCLSLDGIFNKVIPQTDSSGYYLSGFYILLNCVIMYDISGKINKNTTDNMMLELGKDYEFLIRLTHIDSSKGATLDLFSLKLTKQDLRTQRKAFYEFKRFIRVPHLPIPKGLGNYAVKLLIREKTGDQSAAWITQTLTELVIGEIFSAAL